MVTLNSLTLCTYRTRVRLDTKLPQYDTSDVNISLVMAQTKKNVKKRFRSLYIGSSKTEN